MSGQAGGRQRLADPAGAAGMLALPAPAGLHAEPGTGHARLSWEPVRGAAGYLIERTEARLRARDRPARRQ